MPSIAVVIPALNEEQALPSVLQGLAAEAPDALVVVVDNGSTDRTADVARAHGATVIHQPVRGYGGACLAGFAFLSADPPTVVVVMDGDNSDFASDLGLLTGPVLADEADMVLGERLSLGDAGSLLPNQRFGNWLATHIIRQHTGHRYRDMGPFRAIRWTSLQGLQMCDPAYGWNVEMQMKAVQRGLRIQEVPVRYRNRIGQSKISGTVRGTVKAGIGILAACWRYR
mgnify:CR=1 FL=1